MPGNVHLIYIPPDSGWGWAVVFASFTCNFIVEGVIFTYGIFVESLIKDFTGRYIIIMSVCATNWGVYYFSKPFVSALTNRFSLRTVGFVGGIIAALGYCASTMIDSVEILIVTNGIIGGIGLSMIHMPAIIAVGFYFEKYRSTANVISQTGLGAGIFCLGLLLDFIEANYGWINAYILISGLMLLAATMAMFYLPLIPFVVTDGKTQPEKSVLKHNIQTNTDEKTQTLVSRKTSISFSGNKNYPTALKLVDFHTIKLYDNINEMKEENIVQTEASTSKTGNEYKEGTEVINSDQRRSFSSRFIHSDWKNCYNCITWNGCTRIHRMSPFYRDDVLYLHNLSLLPLYRESSPEVEDHLPEALPIKRSKQIRNKKVRFHLGVTRVREYNVEKNDDNKCCLPIMRAMCTLLDKYLFRAPSYYFFLMSRFTSAFGIAAIIIYTQQESVWYGVDANNSIWLYPAVGFGRILGAIIMTYMPRYSVELSYIRLFSLNIICLSFLCAVTILFACKMFTLAEYQISYYAYFGFCHGLVDGFRPILLVWMYGLEHLTNAFGIQMLIFGICMAIAIITNSVILYYTDDLFIVFLIAGICTGLTVLIFTFMMLLNIYEKKHGIVVTYNNHNQDDNTSNS